LHDYYKSFPGYLSVIANISLALGIILLFFDWHISLVFFVITATLWLISSKLHKRLVDAGDTAAVLDRMTAIVDMVRVGTYARLRKKYAARYGEEKGRLLAAAVTNELFSESPSNADAQRFVQSHEDLVEQEVSNLKEDDQIRKVITQMIRVKGTIAHARGTPLQEALLGPVEKLTKLGIFIPGGKTPEPKAFYLMAAAFCRSSGVSNYPRIY
jgi:hypothetical protein